MCPGGCPPQCMLGYTHTPVDRMTDACENITLRNYVVDSNNRLASSVLGLAPRSGTSWICYWILLCLCKLGTTLSGLSSRLQNNDKFCILYLYKYY